MLRCGSLKLWMPLLGLGAMLALAPQSRAQAEVSPDHFDENGVVGAAPAKAAVAKSKQTPAPTQTAQNKTGAAHTAARSASAKKPLDAHKPELVAVDDKRKVPASKPNNR
jgi:hypothetical protein